MKQSNTPVKDNLCELFVTNDALLLSLTDICVISLHKSLDNLESLSSSSGNPTSQDWTTTGKDIVDNWSDRGHVKYGQFVSQLEQATPGVNRPADSCNV